jgi:redox-sensitive bicupin YhaK (pirin superfamily)
MWVTPDESAITPSYQQHEVHNDLLSSGLVTIASGIPGRAAAIGLHNHNAALHAARLQPGDTISIPAAPYLHVFVPSGRVTVEGVVGDLEAGDAVRFTGAEGQQLTAHDPAEVLIWEMHEGLGG